MTIKHLGGVFGRNPTFNDVTIDGGIYIGGNTSSNLLDDYEEGEFTVTLTPSTSGTITLQSGADTMMYTKIGRLVQVQGQLNVGFISAAVGTEVTFTLPVTKGNVTEASEAIGCGVTFDDGGTFSVIPGYVGSSIDQNFHIVVDPSGLVSNDKFYIQFTYTA